MSDKLIRIVILDSQTLVRAGIRMLIDNQPGMQVVGEAETILSGLEIISNLRPDIILAELNLDERTNGEVISSIIKACDSSHLILLTGPSNIHGIQQAVEEGVVGVILKTQPPETLYKAIEKVYAGEVWLERSMVANVLSRLSRNSKPGGKRSEVDYLDELSEREKQIVGLIGQGYKNKKISTHLCITETTVRHHLTSIYSKLGVSDRLELLVFAHRYGLVRASLT